MRDEKSQIVESRQEEYVTASTMMRILLDLPN
jgi:hypothetical protein